MAKSTSPVGRIALGAVLAGGMAVAVAVPPSAPVGSATAAMLNPPAVDVPTSSVMAVTGIASGIPGRAEWSRDDVDHTPAAPAAPAKVAPPKAAPAKAAPAKKAVPVAAPAKPRTQTSRSTARVAITKKATTKAPRKTTVKLTTVKLTTKAAPKPATVSRAAVRAPVIAPVARTGGYVIGNDYPGYSGTDPYRFTARQCTSFVAWRLNSRNGVAFNVFYRGVKWGNASNWGYAARSVGIRVDSVPARGAVAWSSAGHVAWVSRVNGDGTVTIEEYNWNYNRSYHTRTVPVSKFRYIHVADL